MRTEKRWRLVVVAGIVLSLSACGSGSSESSGGGTSPSGSVSGGSSSNWKAVALAGSDSANSSSGNSVERTQQKNVEDVEAYKESVLSYVSQRLAEELLNREADVGKSVSLEASGNVLTLTFQNESFSEGGGTITINGALKDTESSKTEGTIEGEITADIKDVSEKISVDGQTFTETVNGSITVKLSGAYKLGDASGSNVEFTINTKVTAKDVKITGDVAGTINDMNVTTKLHYKFTANTAPVVELTCGGSITASTSDGFSGTCNLSSSCAGCL